MNEKKRFLLVVGLGMVMFAGIVTVAQTGDIPKQLGEAQKQAAETVRNLQQSGSALPISKTDPPVTHTPLSTQPGASVAGEKENCLYELRTYYAAPGKLDALCARFRDHTVKLFEKHGITNIGYWIPVENPDNKLIYLLCFPSADAQAKAWKEFKDDPAWQAARTESEKDGKLVKKIESVLLAATDFSPAINPVAADPARIFELRVYTAVEGKLPNLLSRFRDHTIKLFKKHGMEQIGYWTPVDKKQGADNTLIYILAHKDRAAADKSFKEFRADPAWIAAKKASEDKAGGSLTVKDGVKSTFMNPTDFSPIK